MDIIEENTPDEFIGGGDTGDNSPDENVTNDALDTGTPIGISEEQDVNEIAPSLAMASSLRDKNTPIGRS